MIRFVVEGEPKPKLRARSFIHPKTGKLIVTSDPKTRVAEQTFAARAVRFKPSSPLDGPLVLSCCFYMPVPKYLRAKVTRGELVPFTTKPDLDNLIKMVKDALNGMVWIDDKQIVGYGFMMRVYDLVPRTLVRVEPFVGTSLWP